MMKLHCMVCSAQGTHMSQDTEIATVDRKKLNLPLTHDMFTSPNPEGGLYAPWLPGTDWQTMFCPRGKAHLPWGIGYNDTAQAIRDGGPHQILTDEGTVDVKQPVPTIPPAPVPIPVQVQGMFVCDICGRGIQNKTAFINHYRSCVKKHGKD